MDYRIDHFRQVLREDPSSRLFFQLGDLLRREGQAEEAVKVLEQGLEHHQRYVAAWVSLGRAQLELEQYRQGEHAFERALQLDPENAVAARMLGRAAAARGDWLSAVKRLKLARALSPRDDDLDNELEAAEQHLAGGYEEIFSKQEETDAEQPLVSEQGGGEAEPEVVVQPPAVAEIPAQDVPRQPAPPPMTSLSEQLPEQDLSNRTRPLPVRKLLAEEEARQRALRQAEEDAEVQLLHNGEPAQEEAQELEQAAEPESVQEDVDTAPVPERQVAAAQQRMERDSYQEEPETGGEEEEIFEPESEESAFTTLPSPQVTIDGELPAEQRSEGSAAGTKPMTQAVELVDDEPLPDSSDETSEQKTLEDDLRFLTSDEDEEEEHEPAGAVWQEQEQEEEDESREEVPMPTLTLAKLALAQDDLELAAKTLRALLRKNPDNEEAQQLLSTVLGEGSTPTQQEASTRQEQPHREKIQVLHQWLDAIKIAAERR